VLARPALLGAARAAGLDLRSAVAVPATGEAAQYLDRLGAEAVVIRPDRHILGIASDLRELGCVLGLVAGGRT
jgi:hypothetical protein